MMREKRTITKPTNTIPSINSSSGRFTNVPKQKMRFWNSSFQVKPFQICNQNTYMIMTKTPETTLSIYAANYFFYNYDYSRNSNLDFEQCEQQLKEFKATLLMRDPDRLQEAVAIFRELPKNMQGESIYGDPFKFDLKNPGFDRFDENRYSQPSMTKYELAKTLNELNKKKSTAKDYYNLGLAYYNTSYYGLQWKAMAYYRSSYAPNGRSEKHTS